MKRIPSALGAACLALAVNPGHAATSAPADTLVVSVSEDAYLGNAVFSVAVDGNKVGNTYTATALNSAGASQNVSLSGSWGSGAHTVTVTFLNDAYAGTPSTDRNLYVNKVTYDGAASASTNVAFYSNGSANFPVTAASTTLALEPGVNLSGLEFNAGTLPGRPNWDYGVPGNSELDYYAGKGVMVIRLPVLWERLQPNLLASSSPSTALDPTYLGLITSILTYANTKGMGVIVDVHDYGGYNGGGKIGSSGGVTPAQFAAFWQLLAGALKSHPGLLGYDLMNEPNGMPSAAAWPAAAQAATNAIRNTDTKTPILVEGDNWASAGAWQSVNGSLNIVDPSASIIYEAHVYGDRDNSGSHFTWKDEVANGVTVNTIAQREAVFGAWCRSNARQCMIGEVGVGNDDPSWNTELQNGLVQMKADGLLMATYWAGGPWWGSYPMSIEPNNGVDAPQMSVLHSFKN